MDFGLAALSFQKPPSDGRTFPQLYRDIVRLVQVAEESGFSSAWLAEHHFAEDGWIPAVLPMAGVLLGATGRIRIGTAIAPAPLYDPVRLAEDAAVLDIASGGRFDLGLAVGYRTEEFRAFGMQRRERARRLEEVVEVLRLAWAQDSFSYEGKYYRYDDVSVMPKPAAGTVPVPIGGIMPAAVERAGRIGDGYISSGTLALDELVARVDAARAGAGDRPFKVYITKYCFVWEREEEAWDIYRPGYAYDQQLYAQWYADDAVTGLYRQVLPEAEATERLKEAAVIGTPEQVVRQLAELRDAIGEFQFCARIWVPGIDHRAAEASVRLFGEKVIPQLR